MTPEKLAATLLSCFPDLVFLLAPDDTFLAYHTPDERQLSLAPEQFLGKQAITVLPELWGKLAPVVAEVRATGVLRTLRYRTQTPAGESPFEARILPVEDGNVLLLVREVSELQQTEARAQRQIKLLEELQQIHVISTGGGEARGVFEKLLGVMLRATDSSFGFFGEFSEVDGEPQLRTRAITDISWDEASSRTYQRLAPEGMVFRNMDSLFGVALTTGKPVIANDPAKDPRRGGLPPGHPPLRCFLGVPFFRGERLLGMIGLANRPGGYSEDLLELLAPGLESCAHLLLFHQSEEARTAAETGRLLARREAERFQRLFELSNVNVAVISEDGTLLDANPAYLRTLGWGKDDIFGMDAMSLLHPDDLPRAVEYFRKIFEGEGARGLEARHRHRDGSYRWLLSNGIRDPEQSLFYGVSLDITARKESERRSEEQLRLLEMSEALSGVGHWHLDLVSNRVRWSPEVCRIHGVDPSFSPSLEESTAFYHPEDRATVRAHIEGAIREKRAFTSELRLRREDGKERLVMSSGRPEEDPAGRVVSIFGVFQDITERKMAELELYKLATVANRTHNAVVIADALGVIEWVNEGFERLTGYALSDCVGRTPGSFLQGPGSDPEVIAYMRKQIRLGQGFRAEVMNYHRTGRPYWVQIEVQPVFDASHTLTNFIAIETDISDRKTFEQQLVATREEALKIARLKSQFLANMSHEIRTPINGILGATSLLLSYKLQEPAHEYLEMIRDSGKILLATINDILDFSKSEAGKLKLEQIVFSLPLLLEDTVRVFASDAAERGLSLRWELEEGLSECWIGDPIRIRQILLNLLSNALKFTRAGGVGVRFSRNELGLQGEVVDSGPGIASSQREAIFEPFVQADGSTTREFGGSGLGLAICRDLVARMGGEIRCSEAPGGGARFLFTLALAPTQETPLPQLPPLRPTIKPLRAGPSRPSPSVPPEPAAGLRLLLVEDNPTNARITRKILEKSGHNVTVAVNGQEALIAWRASTFDLILMDVQMPVMDGLEATRILREEERDLGRHTPVIALTANVMEEDIEKCRASGMNAYLAKPFDQGVLLELLAEIQNPSLEKKL